MTVFAAQRSYFYLFTVLVPVLFVSACSKDSGLSGKGSVWDTYDFRHPVPYNAPVPDSRATTYDRYQDYEEYYVPPKGYQQPTSPYSDYEEYYVPPRGYQQPAGGYSDYEGYYTPPQRQKNYNPCIPGDPGCIAGR